MNFQVELNNYCNFTCGYCPNKDMERKREFMRDDVWQTILHRYIVPYREVNRFCPPTFIGHKDSEPLLDKKLPERLRDLSKVCPDMHIDVYSNGVLLPVWRNRNQDFIEFLGTLPNRVRYMMSFHPRNHDGSDNDYISTIAYLREVLRNPPSNIEFITVSHKSRWVTDEMQQAYRRLWQGLPITVHCNAALNPWTGRITDEGTIQFNGCPYSDFGHFFFGVTGNIIACCLDLEEEIILGNVMEDVPQAMFEKTAEFYAEQRKTLEEKRRVRHPVCANCFGQTREHPLLQLGVG
jgi:sulfatase maturation enzyme AslB (radical SAM superfamily)